MIKYIAPTGLAVCNTCGEPAEWCLNPFFLGRRIPVWDWICHDCYYDMLEVS